MNTAPAVSQAKTLTAKLPDGRIVSRKTAHRYLYVVACFSEASQKWGALSWHHSYDNAMTQTQSNWKRAYPKMHITPVIENMEFTA